MLSELTQDRKNLIQLKYFFSIYYIHFNNNYAFSRKREILIDNHLCNLNFQIKLGFKYKYVNILQIVYPFELLNLEPIIDIISTKAFILKR